jgi:ReqiPepy6 Gp37-like protein
MLVGASIGAEDLAYYQPLFPGNDIMRIFPVNATISGIAMKVMPAWTDSRVTYCRDNGVIPFFSTKVDGNADGLTYVKNQLLAMPSWVLNTAGMYVYITDRHEPEGDIEGGATTYKANFNAFLAMLATLPAAIRAKIKCGPVLTKTWTESSATGKGNFDYSIYDPGTGDFFGVDMYVSTGTSSTVVSSSTLPTAAAFTQYVKAYKFSAGDTRPRLFPELGLIGMPDDTTGSARAAWLQSVHTELKTWQSGQPGWTQPWNFGGWIWWNQQGKATGVVAVVGQRRDFPLDDRTVNSTTSVKLVPPLPLNKFNEIWALEHGLPAPGTGGGTGGGPSPTVVTPTWTYWVGATMRAADIGTYEPLIPRNGLVRIFPNSDGLPPDWDDERFAYCQRSGATPFVSSNIDGDSSKFVAMKQWIIDMPAWLRERPTQAGRPRMLLTDRHEPENNYPGDPGTYLSNYNSWYDSCIATLPAATRALVWAGPVVTRQWIEGGPTKGNGNYGQYDPGPTKSDFYGLDAYMNSWNPSNSANVATSYTDPAAFLAGLKGYKYNVGDARPRVIGELGAIGIPNDTTGSARAAWLNGICAELDTWTEEFQGWKFIGFSWWNNQGTGGASLNPIGTARYFYLDKYQNSSGLLTSYASPAPLTAFNNQTNSHLTLVTTGGTSGGTAVALLGRSSLVANALGTIATDIPPPVVLPPATPVPASGAAAARALGAIYTVLVTDAFLNVLGDPLDKWQSLQVTLRWKEPGSGQMVLPADPYVRAQLVAGSRIVILRRVLGTQHVLISGPIEQILWEKSDGGDDNAGYGKVTVTFTDDLAWLGARVTYPDPSKTPENQTSDFWVYTGNPEQAMLQLVDTQAGPRALSVRQVPKLQVAAFSGLAGSTTVAIVGTSDVSPREKYEKVTDVLRKICTLGANSTVPGATQYHPDSLGFRVRQTTLRGDPILLFEPLRSRDLAGEVHFSFAKGNLKYFSYELDAPTLTTVIVGGSGVGSEAFVRGFDTLEPGNFTWGRFEGYQASSGTDTLAQMQATANQAFAEGVASARLATSAADTPDQRFGIHYNVGDIVSVELAPGEFEIAPVQTVALQAFPVSGEVVGTTIGDQSARYDSPFIARFRELDRRLARVERR